MMKRNMLRWKAERPWRHLQLLWLQPIVFWSFICGIWCGNHGQ